MRRFILPTGMLCILLLYLGAYDAMWKSRIEVRKGTPTGYVLPSSFSRILALGNKGLLSDFLFLKTVTFFGEHVMYDRAMEEDDWQFIIQGLDVVTELDPYFLDPYVFSEGVLAWEGGKVVEANRFLERGALHRKNEWSIPFFLGFNHFYFLGDYGTGAEYLMVAARVPGSPNFLPTLAARLAYYGDKAKTGVLFLKGLLAETRDPRLTALLERRMIALERASELEELLEKYVADKGQRPANLEPLVHEGYLDSLPEDPYGGRWIILEDGRIFSTSKFVDEVIAKPVSP